MIGNSYFGTFFGAEELKEAIVDIDIKYNSIASNIIKSALKI